MLDASLKINFGTEAVSIPFAAVSRFEKATKKDIKILICLCSLGRLAADIDAVKKAVAKEFGFT